MQKCHLHLAACRPLTVLVVRQALVTLNPGVQQHIAWATIETMHRTFGFKQAEVAETANVQNGASAVLAGE